VVYEKLVITCISINESTDLLYTRSSAIAEAADVTIRSMIAVDRLTLTQKFLIIFVH